MAEIIRWHYNTRSVSRPIIVDLEARVTPEKVSYQQTNQSSGTTKESDYFEEDQYDEEFDRYDAIVEDS